jgi:hypothetical protein
MYNGAPAIGRARSLASSRRSRIPVTVVGERCIERAIARAACENAHGFLATWPAVRTGTAVAQSPVVRVGVKLVASQPPPEAGNFPLPAGETRPLGQVHVN